MKPDFIHPTPRELGFSMPAEWEPHQGTWLSWPHNPGTWPDRPLEPIWEAWAQIAAILSQSEMVYINVAGSDMRAQALEFLCRFDAVLERMRFFEFATNDAWVRDHGPIFVTRSYKGEREVALIDWEYNSWGGKYPCELDNQIPQKVAAACHMPAFKPGIVMEGGSLDVNGRGTLLTTKSCLLNPNRNPHLSQENIEIYLQEFLGVSNILWLGDGIEGDDTDGHIDDLTRFVNPTTVVTILETDKQDPNYEILQENRRTLQKMTDQDGKPLTVVDLPTPGRVEIDGQRVPASYANFYIANESVLVPTFNHKSDGVAMQTLQKLFADRQVVGVDAVAMIWGLGTIHCGTQQMPAGVSARL